MLTSNGEEPIALSSLWLSRLLDALADQLQNKRLLSRTGPVAHQWQHGPLWLERSVEGRARSALPDPETCLAIYLSFVFRRLTPEGDIRRKNDKFEPMPTDGNPRWPIVAALVRDALDARTDEQELIAKSRKRIRSNPGLRIIGYL